MVKILVRKITPQRAEVVRYSDFENSIKDELRRNVLPDIKEDFDKTVEGWSDKPEFRSRLTVNRQGISLIVFPAGPSKDKYNLVSRGAKPHVITSRQGGPSLSFRSGSRAATSPGSINSRPRATFGKQITTRKVNHPGFEGRNFYKQIADLNKVEFKRRIENSLRRAARRNHATSAPLER